MCRREHLLWEGGRRWRLGDSRLSFEGEFSVGLGNPWEPHPLDPLDPRVLAAIPDTALVKGPPVSQFIWKRLSSWVASILTAFDIRLIFFLEQVSLEMTGVLFPTKLALLESSYP